MRFAFLGSRLYRRGQDPETSRGWQLRRSRALIEPAGGVIVAEYFDIGRSRSLPWSPRPEASKLLAALKEPERGFSAVVVGKPQRAFTATSSRSRSRCSSITEWRYESLRSGGQ